MPHGEMTTSRLEAFSDGVIAIIVTIMVLELRAPSQPTWPALLKVAPIFMSYGLSFLVVAIMWVNHHHLIHAVHEVTARLLWSNLNLLFWMSLVPFVTDFLGKNYHQPMAVALYGLDLAMCGTFVLRPAHRTRPPARPGRQLARLSRRSTAKERFLCRSLFPRCSARLCLGLRFLLYLRS